MNNLYYRVYISEEVYKIYFNCILRFKTANTIFVLVKIILKFIKIKFKSRKVDNKDGRASNRKSNDNNNDVARKYD
ncbi:hypothetical protein D3C71_2102880 [compost metagenome]